MPTRTAAQTFALVFGALYLLIGILGLILVPQAGQELFGTFRLNLTHNLIHIVIGLVLLVLGTRSLEWAKRTNVGVGLVYAVVAVLGIVNVVVPDLLEANVSDDVLHLSTAVLALFFGTAGAERRV